MKKQNGLIEVEEATRIILECNEDFGVESIPFAQALGRVLREDIHADRDMPPFDRASMDGIAIRFESFDKGNRKFPVEGVQAAGTPQMALSHPDYCLEVMTGAILPKNADTVIPYELVNIEEGVAEVDPDELKYFQNIHKQGLDRKKNDLLLRNKTMITDGTFKIHTIRVYLLFHL